MSELDAKQLGLARHYVEVDQPKRALDLLGTAEVDPDEPEVSALRSAALLRLERHAEGPRRRSAASPATRSTSSCSTCSR